MFAHIFKNRHPFAPGGCNPITKTDSVTASEVTHVETASATPRPGFAAILRNPDLGAHMQPNKSVPPETVDRDRQASDSAGPALTHQKKS